MKKLLKEILNPTRQLSGDIKAGISVSSFDDTRGGDKVRIFQSSNHLTT